MSLIARFGATSRLATAAVLAAGLSVAFAAPAYAAKKDEKAAAAPKSNYSKPFVTVYQPFAAKVKAEGDATALKVEVPGIVAAATTADDKYAAGQIVYQLGAKLNDFPLQQQGVGMMVDSGSSLVATDKPKLLYALAQLYYQTKDFTNAQARAEQAVAAGYSGDAELLLSELSFAQNNPAAGLATLDKAIARKVAAGEAVPESWLKRAIAQAYEAKLEPQAFKYGGMYAQYYPSTTSWGDAIALQRNFRNYSGQELLDLMRLAQRTKALRYERDYVDYIEAADARRLPGETQRIIDAGIAAGLLKGNDVYVNEARTIAGGRVKADTADLANLERDARLGTATATTLMAAGDAFLSYQQSAKAEEFYKLALAKSGVDAPRVLTRLGIAQLDQGKFAEADANFVKVEGARQAIAQLWSAYAKQAAKPATTAQ